MGKAQFLAIQKNDTHCSHEDILLEEPRSEDFAAYYEYTLPHLHGLTRQLRFKLKTTAYIVLGCQKFWEVMSKETVHSICNDTALICNRIN